MLAWNTFREHGPHLRFDPHPPPVRHHAGSAFGTAHGTDRRPRKPSQADRTIDRFRGHPYLTGLRFTRELRLLDIATDGAGAWATRPAAPSRCQPVRTRSRSAGHVTSSKHFPVWMACTTTAVSPAVGLLRPLLACLTAMHPRPILSLPLTHPGLALRIAAAAQRLGYLVV